MLNLKKPLICLDIETTGLNILDDKIIELYMLKKNTDGTTEEYYSRFNPYPTQISESAFDKHGITLEDLQNEPYLKDALPEILEFISDGDLLGYNLLHFDIPMFIEECIRYNKVFNHRGRKIFDAYRIWTHYEKRTLADAVTKFLGREIKDYHTSKGDVEHTFEVFEKQMEMYSDNTNFYDVADIISSVPKKIDFNGFFVLDENNNIIVSTGKHKGANVESLAKTEPDYFAWIINKSSMPTETKLIAKKLFTAYK
jgi:DNA polymerase-3 subunit epsilon